MSLLKLSGIGKIYVSDSTVAVGIRGVNLEFDRGEFVAITGQSGSGKSTLLNVISGMDSYEEGELYIEGEPTSHYTQGDWEKYREKYISFVFQEYNIIDSFTVLENVELSLMHISNPKVRRERAIELIKRVGLEKHIKHKGSHLSGGQKQRTVIARALAKDSPIILADEPTGNLDSETSKEIIQLLKEVSKDKLLIVVTHNFDEVSECATREIRVYDHAVASDRELSAEKNLSPDENAAEAKNEGKHNTIRNSIALGWSVFKSKPRLSTFICLLLVLASALLFFVFAAFWGEVRIFFLDENYMFNDIPGRVVVVRQDGKVITAEEMEKIAADTGAKDCIRFDYAMDGYTVQEWRDYYPSYDTRYRGIGQDIEFPVNVIYGKEYGKLDIGRYPENADECVLSMPYFMREQYGTDSIEVESLSYRQVKNFRVVGIHYYLDSDKRGEVLTTKEGVEEVSILTNCLKDGGLVARADNGEWTLTAYNLSVPQGKYYYEHYDDMTFEPVEMCVYYRRPGMYTAGMEPIGVRFDKSNSEKAENYSMYLAAVNPKTVFRELKAYMEKNYRQCSLFFSSSSGKRDAIKKLNELGYLAVSASSTFKMQSYLEIASFIVMGIVYLAMWFLFLVFLSFFLRICTKKSMDAFKNDIAIMRSMGIRVKEIKAAVYIRLFICVIPAAAIIPVAAQVLYRTDFAGRNLAYMYLPQYLVIYLLLLLVVTRTARRHVANLFSENVRKALKGE